MLIMFTKWKRTLNIMIHVRGNSCQRAVLDKTRNLITNIFVHVSFLNLNFVLSRAWLSFFQNCFVKIA